MRTKLEYMKDNHLGGEMMISVKLTHVGAIESDILIGDSPITVDNDDLVEAFDVADSFLDQNIDGG